MEYNMGRGERSPTPVQTVAAWLEPHHRGELTPGAVSRPGAANWGIASRR
jgi:hypothetical protein